VGADVTLNEVVVVVVVLLGSLSPPPPNPYVKITATAPPNSVIAFLF
jgi:hypothetical protein